MDEQTQTSEEITLQPSAMTYIRLVGVIAADIVSIFSLYQSFDPILATVLTVLILIATVAAAWFNNSISAAALAADEMKTAFSDSMNQEEIKSSWKTLNETFHAVYAALKQKKEQ